MNSTILGYADVDQERLRRELAKIQRAEFNPEYSEFVSGGWTNCVLRNPTGSALDGLLRDYEGPARPTELATQLDYVEELVTQTFNEEYLRWLRVFIFFHQGKLLPHRDFLEVERAFTRLHLPLQTDESCWHSEDRVVFHMRPFEVWYIDTSQVHSACNLSDIIRISLVLDFTPGVPLERLVKNPLPPDARPVPLFKKRAELGEAELQRILQLSKTLTRANFMDVVWHLAEIHFHKRVSCGSAYDWLIEITRRAGDPALLAQALAMKRFFTEGREVGERFSMKDFQLVTSGAPSRTHRAA